MGIDKIEQREKELVELAMTELKKISKVRILEEENIDRLGIIYIYTMDHH